MGIQMDSHFLFVYLKYSMTKCQYDKMAEKKNN